MTLEELNTILEKPNDGSWIDQIRPVPLAWLDRNQKPPPRTQADAIKKWRGQVLMISRYAPEAQIWPLVKGWASALVGNDAPPEWRIEGGYEAMCAFWRDR